MIRKLSKRGLVERLASPDDQRLSMIPPVARRACATPEPLLAKSVEVGRRVLAPLKPSERAMFMEMLSRVADAADEPDAVEAPRRATDGRPATEKERHEP